MLFHAQHVQHNPHVSIFILDTLFLPTSWKFIFPSSRTNSEMISFLLCRCIWKLCLKNSMKLSQTILLFWSGRSVKEFVEACKKATGEDIKVQYLSRRPGDYAEVYSDPSKIRRELNWTAQYTDLQKSLRIAWNWQKSHRNGYGSPLVVASWLTHWFVAQNYSDPTQVSGAPILALVERGLTLQELEGYRRGTFYMLYWCK